MIGSLVPTSRTIAVGVDGAGANCSTGAWNISCGKRNKRNKHNVAIKWVRKLNLYN